MTQDEHVERITYLFNMREHAELPDIVDATTVTVPDTLRIPPPRMAAELRVIVEPVTVSVPSLKNPPP